MFLWLIICIILSVVLYLNTITIIKKMINKEDCLSDIIAGAFLTAFFVFTLISILAY